MWMMSSEERAVAPFVRAQRQFVGCQRSIAELFSGRVAHDILSPLQVVGLALGAASKSGKDPVVGKMSKSGLASLARASKCTTPGPGLTAGEARRVFDPFVRANVPGVSGIGLGLATVSRIAKAHGGRAGVESVKGKGSVFWFEIPSPPQGSAFLRCRHPRSRRGRRCRRDPVGRRLPIAFGGPSSVSPDPGVSPRVGPAPMYASVSSEDR